MSNTRNDSRNGVVAVQVQRKDSVDGRAQHPTLRGWRTLAFCPSGDAEAETARQRERFGAHADTLVFRTREKNPPHAHVPEQTVQLGHALDLSTQFRDARTLWDFEVKDWHMLTDANAMDLEPGRAALYLVRGKLDERGRAAAFLDSAQSGAETYERWHEREAKQVGELDVPDLVGVYVGRAMRIGYRSDKWNKRGDTIDYDHDFTEGHHIAPECWADNADLAHARALVIVGGDMRVTEDGID